MKFTALEIAEILNGKIDGDSSNEITSLNKIEESTKNSITFLGNKKYIPWVYKTKASMIIVSEDFKPTQNISATLIRVKDPYIAFVKLLHKFDDSSIKKSEIKDSAVISVSSKIGKNVSIGHFSCIGENVVIGKNVVILNNVNIDDGVTIGNNSIIYSGVTIYKNCIIGNNCILHSNSVIGSDGFGFAPDSSGKFQKVPQIGNVEIGASTTIDRATLGSTVINKGVKLDNLVQIGHNVVIGENTVMAAQCGIAGSTKIGKNCQIGGHVGMVGHITIGDNVKINGKACVFKSVKDNLIIKGSPAFEERAFNKSYVHFKNLDKYVKDIENLKKKK
jgi:UDP-3-O-[3-hydroxymyristoyl] glucosamine N-acyltransferase